MKGMVLHTVFQQRTQGCRLLFWISVFISFGSIPQRGISGSYTNSVFNFLGKFHIAFHSAFINYIPTNSTIGFSFLYILTSTCYVLSFWWWPFWQMWGAISLGFWFTFTWWLAVLSIFSCSHCPSAFPLWKNVYSGLLSILKSEFFGCCVVYSFFFQCMF